MQRIVCVTAPRDRGVPLPQDHSICRRFQARVIETSVLPPIGSSSPPEPGPKWNKRLLIAVAAYWSSISVTTVGYFFERPVGLPSRLQSCVGSGAVMPDRCTYKPRAEPAKSDRH